MDKSIKWINKAKVFGIVLVVFAHAITPGIRQINTYLFYTRQFIYTFHMPFFMLLSGFLFEINLTKYRRSGFVKFARNKFVKLMIPYLTLSVLNYLAMFLCGRVPFLSGIAGDGINATRSVGTALFEILTLTNHIDEHMWFVYTLFCMLLLCYLTPYFWKSPIGVFTSVIMAVFLTLIPMPEVIDRIANYLVFFSFGRLLVGKKYTKEYAIKLLRILIPIIVCLAVLNSYFWGGNTFFEDYVIAVKIIRRVSKMILAVLCCQALFTFFVTFENSNFKWNLTRRVYKSEYGIYLLHQPFIVSGMVGILLRMRQSFALSWVYVIIGTCMGILVPIAIIVWAINNSDILSFLILGIKKERGDESGAKERERFS